MQRWTTILTALSIALAFNGCSDDDVKPKVDMVPFVDRGGADGSVTLIAMICTP